MYGTISLTVLAAVSVVLQAVILYLIYYRRVPKPKSKVHPAIHKTGDTKTLRLCQRGVLKHEVSLHVDKLPTTYSYGGKSYQFVERTDLEEPIYTYEEQKGHGNG